MASGLGGWGAKKKTTKKKKNRRKAVQYTLITAYVLSITFITLCAAHTYAKLIAQEVE